MASPDDPTNDRLDGCSDGDPSDVDPSDGEKSPQDLIRTHQAGLWRYLRMLGCDASLADDITQETFLKVLHHDSFTQHSDKSTAAYLRRTAHNLLVSMHRKGGRKRTTFTSDPLDEIWDRWAGRDLTGDHAIDCLRECMQALTERAQKALRMRFADESSRSSIAEALEITEHGARNLMQRAKQQLRDCVQQRLNENEHDDHEP
jgi:RNA polymerase sigma-70 factor (ECF subfamily)